MENLLIVPNWLIILLFISFLVVFAYRNLINSTSINIFFTFILSIATLLLAYISYVQTKENETLSQANVIVSENDFIFGKNNGVDSLVPVIRNIGKSRAKNVKFAMYDIPIIATSTSIISGAGFTQIFNDYMVGYLEAEEKATFGQKLFLATQCTLSGKKIECPVVWDALVFSLDYEDGLTGRRVHKNIFLKYEFGKKEVSTLFENEYKIVYEQIKSELEKEKENNIKNKTEFQFQDLLDFIYDNPPS